MSLVKKIKDILFEEEEYTEPIKIKEEVKEEPKIVKIEPSVEKSRDENREEVKKEISRDSDIDVKSERELFRSDNTFKFPDFDEEEFSNMAKPRVKPAKSNVLEYERKKTIEKRTDYGRYERIETREYTEKKKFKPSPIISPVYGVLNQDYKADDIVNKNEVASNIDIEVVRKKAFEPKLEEVIEKIDEPVVTFFEEKNTVKIKEEAKEDYKSIDDLLESASDELSIENTLEIPKTNNLDVIEEELEKLDNLDNEKKDKEIDDTLDSDLFELIDSMYDEREEE